MSSKPIEFPLKGSINAKECKKGISYRAVIDLPSNNGNRRQKKKCFPDWKFENPIEEAKAWLVQKNPKYSKEDYLENVEIGFIEYLKSWHKEKIGEIRGKTRQKGESGIIGKPHLIGMWTTNLLFGWTILGWFLIWFWILLIVGKKGVEEGISNLKNIYPLD